MNAIHAIRVTGTARAIESVVHVPLGGVVAGEFRCGDRDNPSSVVAHPQVFGRAFTSGSTRLKFKFSRNTKPGVYVGTVRVGESEHLIEAEVQPEPHAEIAPSRVYCEGTAGGAGSADILVSNNGNQLFEISKVHGIGLFATDGIENALGAAYRTAEEGGLERVVIVADKLVEAHGGLVRVEVEKGAGMLAPDEVRNVKLRLRFPDNIRAGKLYTGSLRILNAECLFEVQAVKSKADDHSSANDRSSAKK